MLSEKGKIGRQKAKENPFLTLPLQALKVRRSFIVATVLCFARWHGIQFKDGFKWGGNKLLNMDEHLFNTVLLCTTLYLGIYYSMLGWNTFLEWKLRASTFVHANALPYPYPTVNETYVQNISRDTAWREIENHFYQIRRHMKNLPNQETLKDAIEKFETGKLQKPHNLGSMDHACKELAKITAKHEENTKVQLKAFEKTFWEYIKSSYLNFFFIEYLGPLAIGALGLVLLTYRMYTQLGI